MAVIDAIEGWDRPANSLKWHYFRRGMSLCRRWGYFGRPQDPDDKPSPDNCAACWKRRQKEQAP